jgi:hypothetical protein
MPFEVTESKAIAGVEQRTGFAVLARRSAGQRPYLLDRKAIGHEWSSHVVKVMGSECTRSSS